MLYGIPLAHERSEPVPIQEATHFGIVAKRHQTQRGDISPRGDQIRARQNSSVGSDNGNGFDPEAAKAKESLGLTSIDERVRAVKGEAKVISAVGAGTTIEVHVPVGNDSQDEVNHNSRITINNQSIGVVVADDSTLMLERS